MSQGIIYMAWGENAVGQCVNSLRTLRQFAPTMNVIVTGDVDTEKRLRNEPRVKVKVLDVDPFETDSRRGYTFRAGRIKPLLYGISPWDRTLYVDADVFFQESPERGFRLLDRWDFVLSEHVGSSLRDAPFEESELNDTAEWLGVDLMVYHNSGMLFWRRCDAVKRLMTLWSEEWERYGDWDEQIALLRALMRSEALFLTVPYTWNNNQGRQATFLYHRYGTQAARVDGRRSQRRQFSPNIGQPLVEVDVGRGRFVKCHQGDEARVIALYRRD